MKDFEENKIVEEEAKETNEIKEENAPKEPDITKEDIMAVYEKLNTHHKSNTNEKVGEIYQLDLLSYKNIKKDFNVDMVSPAELDKCVNIFDTYFSDLSELKAFDISKFKDFRDKESYFQIVEEQLKERGITDRVVVEKYTKAALLFALHNSRIYYKDYRFGARPGRFHNDIKRIPETQAYKDGLEIYKKEFNDGLPKIIDDLKNADKKGVEALSFVQRFKDKPFDSKSLTQEELDKAHVEFQKIFGAYLEREDLVNKKVYDDFYIKSFNFRNTSEDRTCIKKWVEKGDKDFQIYVEKTPENVQKVVEAYVLNAFINNDPPVIFYNSTFDLTAGRVNVHNKNENTIVINGENGILPTYEHSEMTVKREYERLIHVDDNTSIYDLKVCAPETFEDDGLSLYKNLTKENVDEALKLFNKMFPNFRTRTGIYLSEFKISDISNPNKFVYVGEFTRNERDKWRSRPQGLNEELGEDRVKEINKLTNGANGESAMIKINILRAIASPDRKVGIQFNKKVGGLYPQNYKFFAEVNKSQPPQQWLDKNNAIQEEKRRKKIAKFQKKLEDAKNYKESVEKGFKRATDQFSFIEAEKFTTFSPDTRDVMLSYDDINKDELLRISELFDKLFVEVEIADEGEVGERGRDPRKSIVHDMKIKLNPNAEYVNLVEYVRNICSFDDNIGPEEEVQYAKVLVLQALRNPKQQILYTPRFENFKKNEMFQKELDELKQGDMLVKPEKAPEPVAEAPQKEVKFNKAEFEARIKERDKARNKEKVFLEDESQKQLVEEVTKYNLLIQKIDRKAIGSLPFNSNEKNTRDLTQEELEALSPEDLEVATNLFDDTMAPLVNHFKELVGDEVDFIGRKRADDPTEAFEVFTENGNVMSTAFWAAQNIINGQNNQNMTNAQKEKAIEDLAMKFRKVIILHTIARESEKTKVLYKAIADQNNEMLLHYDLKIPNSLIDLRAPYKIPAPKVEKVKMEDIREVEEGLEDVEDVEDDEIADEAPAKNEENEKDDEELDREYREEFEQNKDAFRKEIEEKAAEFDKKRDERLAQEQERKQREEQERKENEQKNDPEYWKIRQAAVQVKLDENQGYIENIEKVLEKFTDKNIPPHMYTALNGFRADRKKLQDEQKEIEKNLARLGAIKKDEPIKQDEQENEQENFIPEDVREDIPDEINNVINNDIPVEINNNIQNEADAMKMLDPVNRIPMPPAQAPIQVPVINEPILPEDQNRPEGHNNPGRQRIKNFISAKNNYTKGVDGIKYYLNGIKNRLIATQDDQTKNFGSEEREGSRLYQRLTESINALLENLNNENTRPEVIKASMMNVYRTACSYFGTHFGFFGLKGTERGDVRLKMSENLINKMPVVMNAYEDMRARTCIISNEENVAYGNENLKAVKEKADEFAGWYPTIAAEATPGVNFTEQMDLSRAQLRMRNHISKFTKTMANSYGATLPVDHYLTIKPNESIVDKAKYLMAKKFLDKVHRPGVTKAQAEAAVREFTPDTFKREYEALAKNSTFKKFMQTHANNGMSEWLKVEEKTQQNRAAYRERFDEYRGYGATAQQEFNERNTGLRDMEPFWNDTYKGVAEIITLRILNNPNDRSFANNLATYGNVEEGKAVYDQMVDNVKNYLVRKNALRVKNNETVEGVVNRVAMSEDVMKAAAKNYKQALERAQQNRAPHH